MKNLNDTIAAISTPIGTGGIGIIRLSGERAISIADKIFRGKIAPSQAKSHTINYGYIVDPAEKIIDEVMLSVMRKPATFTREDVVEINCHGGVYLTKKILEIAIDAGARLAEPGEFTQRAFLNGRIDLTQAEAIADIIRAQTEAAHQVAIKQLQGDLRDKIGTIKQRIINLLSMVELTIDFSEEDLNFAQEDELTSRTEEIIQEINTLLKTAEEGRIMREGVVVAITGKPNVGKSSLLNTILKEERAIVTHIPGTTRDTIEEDIELNGVLVRLIDTAGLRKTEDLVERIGVDKSKLSLEKADLVLFVIDASENLDEEDHEIMEHLTDKNVIGVRNKIDLLSADSKPPKFPFDSVDISATENIGLDKLHETLVNNIISDKIQLKEHVIITKTRHKQALLKALNSMKEVRKSLEKKVSSEFLAVDLNGALQALGEIVGMTTPDDILNNIFNNFCIGK